MNSQRHVNAYLIKTLILNAMTSKKLVDLVKILKNSFAISLAP